MRAGHAANRLRIADPSRERRDIAGQLGAVQVFDNNADAARDADVLVLAVKPHLIEPVCRDLADAVTTAAPLVLSVAAGVTMAAIGDALGGYARLVRIMPNTPALVGRGASGLYADPGLSDEDRAQTEALVSAFGQSVWVGREDGLHDVTAISGSGPAYFFLFMEHLEREALALGMNEADAALLVRETAAGAAEMALRAEVSLAELRRRVTSPGGTTQAAVAAFDDAGFNVVVHRAVAAARQRSVELAAPDAKD